MFVIHIISYLSCSLVLTHCIIMPGLDATAFDEAFFGEGNGWMMLYVVVQNQIYFHVLTMALECTIVTTLKMLV